MLVQPLESHVEREMNCFARPLGMTKKNTGDSCRWHDDPGRVMHTAFGSSLTVHTSLLEGYDTRYGTRRHTWNPGAPDSSRRIVQCACPGDA